MDCVCQSQAGSVNASQIDHELQVGKTFRLKIITPGTFDHILKEIQTVIIALCFRVYMLLCEALLNDGYNKLLGPAEAEVRDPRRRQDGGYPLIEHAWEQA